MNSRFSPQQLKSFTKAHLKNKKAPIVQGIFEKNKEKSQHVLYNPLLEVTTTYLEHLPQLVDIMHESMTEHDGIGIAANQIGVPLQIFLMESANSAPQTRYKNLDEVGFKIILNPKIIKSSKELTSFWHGCLSAKGKKMGQLATYSWIEYEAQDLELSLKQERISGLEAIIFQHEFRHLLGGTYLDFAKKLLSPEELQEELESGKTKNLNPCSLEVPHLLSDYKIGEKIK